MDNIIAGIALIVLILMLLYLILLPLVFMLIQIAEQIFPCVSVTVEVIKGGGAG